MIDRRTILGFVAFVVSSICISAVTTSSIASAAETVKLVVGYPPGGSTDLAARVFAATASSYTDDRLTIVHRSGAGGTMAATQVFRSKPDGTVLLMARSGSNTVAPAMKKNLKYRYNDFNFIGILEKNPFVCAVGSKSKFRELKDLISHISTAPGTLRYSSSGFGATPHLASLMLMHESGISHPNRAAVNIPFKGERPAIAALVSGDVDFTCSGLAPMLPFIRSGDANPLIVMMPERLVAIPNVPTARELGLKNLEVMVAWTGLAAPPGASPATIKKWEEILSKLNKDKSWNSLTKSIGSIPSIMSSEDALSFIRQQYNAFLEISREINK